MDREIRTIEDQNFRVKDGITWNRYGLLHSVARCLLKRFYTSSKNQLEDIGLEGESQTKSALGGRLIFPGFSHIEYLSRLCLINFTDLQCQRILRIYPPLSRVLSRAHKSGEARYHY